MLALQRIVKFSSRFWKRRTRNQFPVKFSLTNMGLHAAQPTEQKIGQDEAYCPYNANKLARTEVPTVS
jgi:hypothetical protein